MDYPAFQDRARLELARRVAILGQDVSAWTTPVRTQALGLSGPQRAVLIGMTDVLKERQQTAYDAVNTSPLAANQFGDRSATLLQEMTGSQELWRVFRSILGQLEDAALRDSVRAATRIAADCYTSGILRARDFGVITPERYREQPLVYLEAVESPATASRQARAQILSASIRQWRNLKLPLPIVLLPMDYIRSMSSYCCIHHEVGHNLDQDLGLLPDLRAALPGVLPAASEPSWRRWSAEVLADAVGVVLGGAGFALSLGTLALSLHPAARYKDLDPEAVHPPLALRVPLIASLLRKTGVADHAAYADQLTALWASLPRPAWVDEFAGQAQAVAELFLDLKLQALGNRTLLELSPDAGKDHDQTKGLADWLRSGMNRPAPASPDMCPRLVPSAAQLAVWDAHPLNQTELDRIERDAFAYLDLIPAITVLAAPQAAAANRITYLRELTRAIDFGKVRTMEPQ